MRIESLLDSLGLDMPTDRLFHSDAIMTVIERQLKAIAENIEELQPNGYFVMDRRVEGRSIVLEFRPFAAAITAENLSNESQDN